MSQQTINVGTSPNDGTGTPLRTAFQYTNSNFSELYTAVGPSGNNIVVPGTATITGDLTVDTSTLKVDSTNNRVGIGTATPGTRFVVSGGRTGLFSADAFSLALAQTSGQANYAYLGTDASGNLLFSESSGSTIMTLSQSGNLGLGVTPSAWSSGIKVFEFGTKGGLAGSGSDVNLIYNAYYDGSNKYRTSDYANNFQITGGGFKWLTAPSGTAGNAITYTQAMTLDASGNLGINGSASATGIDTGVTRLFVVSPNSNTGYAATLIADSSGRGLLLADQGKTNSFSVDFASGLVKAGAFTSGTSVAFYSNAVERVRIKSTGQVRFVPLAADPAGAEAGDVYYNSVSNKLKCYNGTTWNDLF